jgi:hypothetical protein
MLKGTDIGPLIPHVGPPSNLIPLEMVFSSSKSHFSTSRYSVAGEKVAVSLVSVINPNLNCGTPVPTPTGLVLSLSVHRVDMTWGDIFAGAFALLADGLTQWALNALGGKPGSWLFKRLQQKFAAAFLQKAGARVFAESGEAFIKALDEAMKAANLAGQVKGSWAATAIGTVIAFLAGGPMGADVGAFGGYNGNRKDPWTPGGKGTGFISEQAEALGQALGSKVEKLEAAASDYLWGPGPDDYPGPESAGANPT